MHEQLAAIKFNLRSFLRKLESFNLTNTDYSIISCLNKIENKLFELNDLIEELEEIIND